MIRYLSICSGIEAATAAWHVLGWKAVAYAEIEAFPCAVLAHHYPDVPNLGDLTRYHEWPDEMLAEVDLLVGGTPCQAFSVAGNRNSLADERGNLTLIYAHLLDRIDEARARAGRPPALCLWENVPGVLSTGDNALGCFLGELAGEDGPLTPPGGRWTDAGYVRGPKRAIAWRCLDAQYFGLAQRRDRVFLVAGAGDAGVEQILFEREGVRRDSPPSRGQGQGVAGTLGARTKGGGGLGTDFELGGGLVPEVVGALSNGAHNGGGLNGQDACSGRIIPHVMAHGQAGAEIGIGIGTTLNCNHEAPIVFKPSHFTRGKDGAPAEVAAPLSAESDKGDQEQVVLAFVQDTRDEVRLMGADVEAGSWKRVSFAADCIGDTDDPDEPGDECSICGLSYADECECPGPTQDGMDYLEVDGVLYARQDPERTGPLDSDGTTQAVCFESRFARNGRGAPDTVAPPLKAESGTTGKGDGAPLVAIGADCFNGSLTGDVAATLGTRGSSQNSSGPTTISAMQVRRLTPRECERLQGFPDDYTLIPYRGKPAADGPRYKALGNSKAVPVVRWLGRRIDAAFSTQAPTNTNPKP